MADYITKIRTSSGDKQIDYNALANKPTIPADTSAHVSNKSNPHSVTAAQVGTYTSGEIDTRINNINNVLNSKAPAYTYGTGDLTAGVSGLATGTLYFVYE